MGESKGESKPRRLGRGLSALLDSGAPVAIERALHSATVRYPDGAPEVAWVEVASVRPSPYQPRHAIDEVSLERLADSIRSSGVIQPILVRRVGGELELIAGERRWRAATKAGLARVPAIVRDISDQQAAELSIIENLQREDLNPIERGAAFRRLAEEFGMTHGQIAERVGLERPTVANFIRLTELEEPIQRLISAGRLSAGHGKALLGITDAGLRSLLAQRAADEAWNTRRLERAAAGAGRVPNTTQSDHAPHRAALGDLERQLGDHLGTKVTIHADARGQRGRLVIEFYSLDHFDGLMFRLGFEAK